MDVRDSILMVWCPTVCINRNVDENDIVVLLALQFCQGLNGTGLTPENNPTLEYNIRRCEECDTRLIGVIGVNRTATMVRPDLERIS